MPGQKLLWVSLMGLAEKSTYIDNINAFTLLELVAWVGPVVHRGIELHGRSVLHLLDAQQTR